VQVELSRSLYMSEETKRLSDKHVEVQEKLEKALSYILSHL
jgi:N-formylglutamate amidohydrolase